MNTGKALYSALLARKNHFMDIGQIAGFLNGALRGRQDRTGRVIHQQPGPQALGGDQGRGIGKGFEKLVVVVETKQLKHLVTN